MDNAYIDEDKAQALCCWNAPDKPSVEALFEKAGITTQEIQEVVQFAP